MSQPTFLERVRARVDRAAGNVHVGDAFNYQRPPQIKRHRHVVQTNRWDRKLYHNDVRPTEPIDNLIDDLDLGDHHMGGERRGFDAAPELVEGVFHSLWKAAPRLT